MRFFLTFFCSFVYVSGVVSCCCCTASRTTCFMVVWCCALFLFCVLLFFKIQCKSSVGVYISFAFCQGCKGFLFYLQQHASCCVQGILIIVHMFIFISTNTNTSPICSLVFVLCLGKFTIFCTIRFTCLCTHTSTNIYLQYVFLEFYFMFIPIEYNSFFFWKILLLGCSFFYLLGNFIKTYRDVVAANFVERYNVFVGKCLFFVHWIQFYLCACPSSFQFNCVVVLICSLLHRTHYVMVLFVVNVANVLDIMIQKFLWLVFLFFISTFKYLKLAGVATK